MQFSIVLEGHDLRFVSCIRASLNMRVLFYHQYFLCYNLDMRAGEVMVLINGRNVQQRGE